MLRLLLLTACCLTSLSGFERYEAITFKAGHLLRTDPRAQLLDLRRLPSLLSAADHGRLTTFLHACTEHPIKDRLVWWITRPKDLFGTEQANWLFTETPAPGLQRDLSLPYLPQAAPRYHLWIPANYNPQKPSPVILALHGYQGRAADLIGPLRPLMAAGSHIVLFAICPEPAGDWTTTTSVRTLLRQLRHLSQHYHIDYRRISSLGVSSGATGSWHLAAILPELFHASLAIGTDGIPQESHQLGKLAANRLALLIQDGDREAKRVYEVCKAAAGPKRPIPLFTTKHHVHDPSGWQDVWDWLCAQESLDQDPRHLLHGTDKHPGLAFPRYAPFSSCMRPLPQTTAAPVQTHTMPDQADCSELTRFLQAWVQCLNGDGSLTSWKTQRQHDITFIKANSEGRSLTEAWHAIRQYFFTKQNWRVSTLPTALPLHIHNPLHLYAGNSCSPLIANIVLAERLQACGYDVRLVVLPQHSFVCFSEKEQWWAIESSDAGYLHPAARLWFGAGRTVFETPSQDVGNRMAMGCCLLTLLQTERPARELDRVFTLASTLAPAHYRMLMARSLRTDSRKAAEQAHEQWPRHAAPLLRMADLMPGRQSKEVRRQSLAKAMEAPVLPPGGDEATRADIAFRLATDWTKDPASPTSLDHFNRAILRCLQLNPHHVQAHELVHRMGGTSRRKSSPGPKQK